MGIDGDTFFPYFFPHHYAYFRDGDLYLLGARSTGGEFLVKKVRLQFPRIIKKLVLICFGKNSINFNDLIPKNFLTASQ